MSTLLTHRDGPVLTLTLNRPEAFNALNQALMNEMTTALDHAATEDAVRAVVITGTDRAFCAGADLTEVAAVTVQDGFAPGAFPGPMFDRIATFTKPLIAAVNGLALGGGCELALACDFAIAGEGASFGLPEVTLGLIPAGGGTQRIVAAIGKAKAMHLVLSGESIDAADAERAGLVSEVTPDALPRALEIAHRIAANAPLAVQRAKDAVQASMHPNLRAGLDHELRNFYLLLGTDDTREGIAAFTEKRTPTYRGH